MAWPRETVKARGIPPAVLPSISFGLFLHSHVDTGYESARKAFLLSRASTSSPSSTVSPGAYFRYRRAYDAGRFWSVQCVRE